MTPTEVEQLPDHIYKVFVRHMQKEAAEIRKLAAKRRR
jgi:hypothetical protein